MLRCQEANFRFFTSFFGSYFFSSLKVCWCLYLRFFPCLFTEEFEAIWYPNFAFHNARLMGDKRGIDVRHTLEVIPNDNFTFLAENNMQIFKGSEHILSLTRESVIDWKCEYAYQWYPFDTQICRMEFVSTKYRTDVYLSRLTFNKNISLSRYSLSNIRMCKSSIDEMRAIIHLREFNQDSIFQHNDICIYHITPVWMCFSRFFLQICKVAAIFANPFFCNSAALFKPCYTV